MISRDSDVAAPDPAIITNQQQQEVISMGTLTLRLPEQLDARLTMFAKLDDSSRSELVRTALERFLRERERDKLMAGMVESAKFLASNPDARTESMTISAEFAIADSEALDLAKDAHVMHEMWWK